MGVALVEVKVDPWFETQRSSSGIREEAQEGCAIEYQHPSLGFRV